jgi:endonuclease III
MVAARAGNHRPRKSAVSNVSGTTALAERELKLAWQGAAGRKRVRRLAALLAKTYGTPDLGNLIDPLDEAVYILLTLQTPISRAREVWLALRARFTTWDQVLSAPQEALADVLRPSGFHCQRAKILHDLLRAVRATFGELSLARCGAMITEEAERQLRGLPGLDRKTARCILLYSFDRAVFPVDSNTYRFSQRYGILRSDTRFRRASVHDALQALVPPAERRALHVNLVVHGQRTCLPRAPLCSTCAVRRSCETGKLASAARRAPQR